ncbi:MAG TPA: ferrochelatase [Actinomycetota bacterium]|jgi:ferrochelatase|nr:ferrochelatase [Actinomycetota bacterium]
MSKRTAPVGVLLMTYGSPSNVEEMPAYLRSIRGGREPGEELLGEFVRRYELIGWSPLVRITREQAEALQRLLDAGDGPGRYLVEVGMLHSEPGIAGAVQRLAAAGAEQVLGIVLSPQYSSIIMGRYNRTLEEAAAALGAGGQVRVAGAWHLLPEFIEALAERTVQALEGLPDDVPVLLTAHSLPKPVVDREPGYVVQLTDTAEAIAKRVGLEPERWRFAYQSAGHTPEEWLRPDLKELLPGLRDAGHRAVLVVPVQFLGDHLEILYDLDVAARQEAEEAGIAFHRIELPNTQPAFIRALAEVVHREQGLPSPDLRASLR